ncbi:GNAT family N-acetyltransferase [Nisaea acidiphila]|uniref:GNAT family N-acetyltransferase n=1 Tax=Nisaea acidiphila TaxID=1862145 RepID=A0A9J7AP86_9PROT|nr:GNAT family N-acetyltransferase [Nisaea acidiphila]UUX48409.1 GNAT family N-acetyltransferase [Nisaea acidiphila]
MAICSHQPFDSEILGGPVYRISIKCAEFLNRLTDAVPQDAILASIRLPADWPSPDQRSGFREIETLVQLERTLLQQDREFESNSIRPSVPADADACAEIAANAFVTDRYRTDPMVSASASARVKAAWARNEVSGRTDRTFIKERDGEVVGFNGCLLEEDVMTVDLIAVSETQQGQGIGADLLRAAFAHYSAIAKKSLIATQATNIGALSLYRKLGYVETARFRTYHYTPEPIGF